MSVATAPKPQDRLWAPLPGSQTLALDARCDHIVYEGARGPGKRCSHDSLVLTDSGWKTVGCVTLADRLVALDGSYTAIRAIHTGYSEKLYRFTFDDGAQVDVCIDHLWRVGDGKNFARDGWLVKDTRELISKDYTRYGIPYCESVDGKQWTGLDPYAIGLMLGDGTMGSRQPTLYSADLEIVEYMRDVHGWKIYKYDSSVCHRAVATNAALATPCLLYTSDAADD